VTKELETAMLAARDAGEVLREGFGRQTTGNALPGNTEQGGGEKVA
jgi:hypothetical protein